MKITFAKWEVSWILLFSNTGTDVCVRHTFTCASINFFTSLATVEKRFYHLDLPIASPLHAQLLHLGIFL